MALSIVACSDDNDMPVPGGEGEVVENAQVSLVFSVADIPENDASRATPTDGEYTPGEGFENYVDIEGADFRIYMFSMANKYIGSFDNITLNRLSASSTARTYEVKADIDPELTKFTDFKVCILANWKSYPSLSAGDDISALWSQADETIYEFNREPLSADHLIPLYGIKEYSNVTFLSNVRTILGTIFMLRAYAKIEINLDKSVRPVKSVVLTRVNDRGFKAPKNVAREGDYVHGSYESDYVNTPNIPSEALVWKDVEVPLIKGDPLKMEERSYVIYVPEYDNTSYGVTPSQIKITYVDVDNTNEVERLIDFKYYQKSGSHEVDEPFSLLRNYIYRFKLRQSAVIVDVQPYALLDIRPAFGLERDADGNIVVRDANGKIIKIIDVAADEELTLQDFSVDQIGSGTAVVGEDGKKKVVYLDDGRTIIYTYKQGKFLKSIPPDGENPDDFIDESLNGQTVLVRWEIYSNEEEPGENFVFDQFIEEDYENYRYNWADSYFYPTFMHSRYDDAGTLIERFVYKSRDSYENGDKWIAKSVDFEGPANNKSYRFGNKTIRYYTGGDVVLTVKLKKVYEQATDNYNEPAFEVDYYQLDPDKDDGSYLLDDQGRRVPVYKYDSEGNKIPIYVYRYEEDYSEPEPEPTE
ncbi:MAG: hypothetical protein NC098_01175 [Lachnoclostridium sp.]|nr:hypothetical protein [Lachnoclostridium sp.]